MSHKLTITFSTDLETVNEIIQVLDLLKRSKDASEWTDMTLENFLGFCLWYGNQTIIEELKEEHRISPPVKKVI